MAAGDEAGVNGAEVGAVFIPPQMGPEVDAEGVGGPGVVFLQEGADAGGRPHERIEGGGREDADFGGVIGSEAGGEAAGVVAPGAVEGGGHGFEPAAGEGGAGLGEEEGVAEGGLDGAGASIAHGVFAANDELFFVEFVGNGADEEGVDVGVNAAVLDEFFQADEIGVVGVAEFLGDEGVVVASVGDGGHEGHVFYGEEGTDEIPIVAVRLVVKVEGDAVGAVYAEAGFEAEVVDEVERFGLGAEAEDEVEVARDAAHGKSGEGGGERGGGVVGGDKGEGAGGEVEAQGGIGGEADAGV